MARLIDRRRKVVLAGWLAMRRNATGIQTMSVYKLLPPTALTTRLSRQPCLIVTKASKFVDNDKSIDCILFSIIAFILSQSVSAFYC